jgi:hypothetical protein
MDEKTLNGNSTWTNVLCADCGKLVWAVMYHGDSVWRPALEHVCINGTVLPNDGLKVEPRLTLTTVATPWWYGDNTR